MKKLRLKALSLGAKEILSREQLKAVFGGAAGSGSGSGDCDVYYDWYCETSDGSCNYMGQYTNCTTDPGECNGTIHAYGC
ncbi:hypothetical protein ACFS5N_12580 [Mucilaginibacter ximonensis]|uniref:Natural product n=1 Tax=Mucilaginibacter ximonensis TaxID=538021 RepID=A0ABW5YD95_9SPHI